MSITLIVTKTHSGSFAKTSEMISLDQWLRLVEGDGSLRLRTEPLTVTNPKTKQSISIDPPPGQTEIRDREDWIHSWDSEAANS